MRDWREENKEVTSIYEESRCNDCKIGTYVYTTLWSRELNVLTCTNCGAKINGNLPAKGN